MCRSFVDSPIVHLQKGRFPGENFHLSEVGSFKTRNTIFAGAEWREATASALQQIPGLGIWPENPSGWINPNTSRMISLKPRKMKDFLPQKTRNTCTQQRSDVLHVSSQLAKELMYNELMHDVQYSVLLTTIATNYRCPMQDQQGLIQSLSSYIPCLQEKCWRHASEIWCTL